MPCVSFHSKSERVIIITSFAQLLIIFLPLISVLLFILTLFNLPFITFCALFIKIPLVNLNFRLDYLSFVLLVPIII